MNQQSFDSIGLEIQIPPNETMLCKFDNKGTVTYVNDFCLQFNGNNIEDLIGKTVFDLKHPDFPVTIFNHIMQYLFQKKNIHILALAETATRKKYWFLTNFYYKTDAKGELISFYSYRQTAPEFINPKLTKLYTKLLKMEQFSGIKTAQKYFEGFLEEEGMDFETYTLTLQEELGSANFLNNSSEIYSPDFAKKKKGFLGRLFKG